mmetsp:Transcript_20966/g.53570  ORF Transcript_20966/g.53570 Transcript_20966/m.53570 type:complete len:213 (-) Transcript_20966:169-807(-)
MPSGGQVQLRARRGRGHGCERAAQDENVQVRPGGCLVPEGRHLRLRARPVRDRPAGARRRCRQLWAQRRILGVLCSGRACGAIGARRGLHGLWGSCVRAPRGAGAVGRGRPRPTRCRWSGLERSGLELDAATCGRCGRCCFYTGCRILERSTWHGHSELAERIQDTDVHVLPRDRGLHKRVKLHFRARRSRDYGVQVEDVQVRCESRDLSTE